MFCQNCGREIDDKAVICIHCGVETKKKGKCGCLGWIAGFIILDIVYRITKFILYGFQEF